jgi:hypothetical protein
MSLEIADGGIQPDWHSQVESAAALFQSLQYLMSPGIMLRVLHHGVFYKAVVFPFFDPESKHNSP